MVGDGPLVGLAVGVGGRVALAVGVGVLSVGLVAWGLGVGLSGGGGMGVQAVNKTRITIRRRMLFISIRPV